MLQYCQTIIAHCSIYTLFENKINSQTFVCAYRNVNNSLFVNTLFFLESYKKSNLLDHNLMKHTELKLLRNVSSFCIHCIFLRSYSI